MLSRSSLTTDLVFLWSFLYQTTSEKIDLRYQKGRLKYCTLNRCRLFVASLFWFIRKEITWKIMQNFSLVLLHINIVVCILLACNFCSYCNKIFRDFFSFRSHRTQFGLLIYSQEIIFVLFERRVYSEHVNEIIMSRWFKATPRLCFYNQG